jgi:hypothetical protein
MKARMDFLMRLWDFEKEERTQGNSKPREAPSMRGNMHESNSSLPNGNEKLAATSLSAAKRPLVSRVLGVVPHLGTVR